MRTILKFAGLAIASVMALGVQTASAQDKKVRIQMQSNFASTLALLGPNAKYTVDQINKLSGGSIDMKFFEPGALVPPAQAFDAVSSGALDAAWATPGFWTGKDIAFAVYSTGAVRPGHGRIPRLDEGGRRREDAAGALRQVQHPLRDLPSDPARGVGLVPQGDQDARPI